MKKLNLTFFYFAFLLIGVNSLSAQVELVADINEGSEGSGSKNLNLIAPLGNSIIFSATDEIVGTELFILEEGQVRLITDLNNDPSSSNPQHLRNFQGAVYFLANDNSGYKIWRTDGSESGTEIAFDLGVEDAGIGDYKVFLINDDELFFTFQNAVYVFDGAELKKVPYENDIVISGSSNAASFGWCTYRDGIALMNFNNNKWDLLYVHDAIVETLNEVPGDDFSIYPYGMGAFEGGLVLSFQASFDEDIEGRFVYIDADSTLTKVTSLFPSRTISVDDKAVLQYEDDGFIYFDSENPMGKLVENGELNLVAGATWSHTITGKYLAFKSSGGTFEDDVISLLNTEDGSVKTIYTGDELSRMIDFSFYILFFAESENSIFDIGLYLYNLGTESLTQIEEFEDLPNRPGLIPFTVQGEYLYFFTNIDESVGSELYRIQLDINTSIVDEDKDLEVLFNQVTSNSFQLLDTEGGNFQVQLFTTDGRLIKQENMSNNDIIEIHYDGLVCVRIISGVSSKTLFRFVNGG